MSEFEKYLKENRESFDREEPTEGHAERFLKRLERADEKEASARITFWRVAAAIIVLVGVCLSVLIPKFNNVDDAQYASLSLGDVSKELADVEFYYQSKLEKESTKLAELAEQDSTVKSYFEEIDRLKEEYRELQVELYSSNAHDKVIQAMIQNFRIRLGILERLENRKQALNEERDLMSYSTFESVLVDNDFKYRMKLRKKAWKKRSRTIKKKIRVRRSTKHNKFNTQIS